jgi:hypothetical protein
MVYTGLFELWRSYLLSLKIKVLYTDINKDETNSKSNVLNF